LPGYGEDAGSVEEGKGRCFEAGTESVRRDGMANET